MKIYLVANETLLFEGFGWGIIEVVDYGVYGTHTECTKESGSDGEKYTYGEYCWYPNEHPVCMVCGEAVPEPIQALIQLKGWHTNRRDEEV